MSQHAAAFSQRSRWLLLAGLMAVALNLRPALTSLAPLLTDIQTQTGLSATEAGLLTTAPVLCLGLFGPLAPWLARRIGNERTVALFLLILAGGCALRAVAPPYGLYLGTLMAGAGIGVIGVLLPGLVKREFPEHAAHLTGVYTLLLCLGAGLAAGLTVPTAAFFNHSWETGLALWSLPAVLALLLWSPQLSSPVNPGAQGTEQTVAIWRDSLAWQVTFFMGLQSSLAYSVFGWLPLIFQSRGASALEGGLLLSASLAAQLLTALCGPLIATRWRDQRPAVVLFLTLTLVGLLCCLFAPMQLAWLWTTILGLGQGGLFSVALALIVLRVRDAHTAGRLSGMAQGVGYTLAALGPLLVGVLHDWRNDWLAVAVLFCTIVGAALITGLGAGRRRFVGDRL